jgi:hypothetical protein
MCLLDKHNVKERIMTKFATTPVEYRGVKAGNPSVNGWMIDTKTIVAEGMNAKARANGRSYGVFVDGKYVGDVHYATGGQYVATNIKREQISTHTGHDAAEKCFIDLLLSVEKA